MMSDLSREGLGKEGSQTPRRGWMLMHGKMCSCSSALSCVCSAAHSSSTSACSMPPRNYPMLTNSYAQEYLCQAIPAQQGIEANAV